jgi:excisionase family DNA binding protein
MTTGTVTQDTIGIREAAALLGCGPKRVRRMVKAGELRGEVGRGRYGEEWRIERASLTLAPPVWQGRGGSDHTRPRPQAEVWAGLLRAMQERLEGATLRLGRLEGVEQERKALEARAGSLVEAEAEARVRADQLAGEVTRLRRERWALAGLAILALGALVWAVWPMVMR